MDIQFGHIYRSRDNSFCTVLKYDKAHEGALILRFSVRRATDGDLISFEIRESYLYPWVYNSYFDIDYEFDVCFAKLFCATIRHSLNTIQEFFGKLYVGEADDLYQDTVILNDSALIYKGCVVGVYSVGRRMYKFDERLVYVIPRHDKGDVPRPFEYKNFFSDYCGDIYPRIREIYGIAREWVDSFELSLAEKFNRFLF